MGQDHLTNEELQKAIDSLLAHVAKPGGLFGTVGGDSAGGAIAQCLAGLLHEQVRRAGVDTY